MFLYLSSILFSGIRNWMAVLSPKYVTIRKDGFLYKEAAMSLYEALDLLLTAIQIIIDVITRLLRKKKKKRKRIKK